MSVAQTILQQLGGTRFLVMTGARDMVGGADYLRIGLPGSLTKHRVNNITVRLCGDDTYTLSAVRVTRATPMGKEYGRTTGVYCDDLQAVFTELTGLATRL